MWGDSKNLVYGCTRNPHDTRRSPGGSSGGEGSLLAAAGSVMGIGTDLAGSVLVPAAYCGIFAHKATSDGGENLEQYNCGRTMTRLLKTCH
ncbi:fatty-acid amide hydrolase 2-A-like [Rhipicephalus sanguineus]|uniref:fatty-acid amide hydrolase 2-A-like n=1 Tax=Rhipicephalus sanguineus TaxID=34632 RepID=UPI0020C3C7FD|nr:fatty-acid amide hydrolase 2-A-like [Rhipicephalus sanguineus]